MGKSTQPVYWGRSVITGHTVVGDMLEWALWVTPIWWVGDTNSAVSMLSLWGCEFQGGGSITKEMQR